MDASSTKERLLNLDHHETAGVPDRSRLTSALAALEQATVRDADLCGPVLEVMGFDHVAVATLGTPLGAGVVCASDATAAQLAKLELELGDGPAWRSAAHHAPVAEPDLSRSQESLWPLTRQRYLELDVGAVYAFPLVAAGTEIGALTLYSRTPVELLDQQREDARALSQIIARQVLYRAPLPGETLDTDDDSRWYSRREIHQACGMVIAQMGISATDALTVLRSHAFTTGRTLRDVSADVVARTLDFTPKK